MLFIIGCNKDIENSGGNEIRLSEREIFEQRVIVANSFSEAMKVGKLKNFVYENILSLEDGDVEMLMYSLVSQNSNESKELKTNIQLNLTKSLDQILKEDPLMTVFYYSADGLVEPKSISNITYIDKVFYGKEIVKTDGQNIFRNVTEEPIINCFALKTNERFFAIDEDSQTEYYRGFTYEQLADVTSFEFFITPNAVVHSFNGITIRKRTPPNSTSNEPILENSKIDAISSRTTCNRDNLNGQDVVTVLKYTTTWEGWFDGRPEFTLNYFNTLFNQLSISPLTFNILPTKTWECYQTTNATHFTDKNSIAFTASPLFSWNNNGQVNFGNRDYYTHWTEDDGGFKLQTLVIAGKHTVKVGGTIPGTNITANVDRDFSISNTVTQIKGNDNIGGGYINYCDNWLSSPNSFDQTNGYPYGTGQFFYWIKERSF